MTALVTNKGTIACDYVVVGVGPWVNQHLEHARPAEARSRSRAATARCMTACACGNTGAWRRARSASIPNMHKTNDGTHAAGHPCRHRRAALFRCRRHAASPTSCGASITSPTSISAASRAAPRPTRSSRSRTRSRSIPTARSRRTSSSATNSSRPGARCWRIARSASRARSASTRSDEKSGGLGCFTPDNFPVFDVFRDNVYVIADSNHGYKMIGVGKLVAQEIAARRSRCSSRSASRATPRASCTRCRNSPFPWS